MRAFRRLKIGVLALAAILVVIPLVARILADHPIFAGPFSYMALESSLFQHISLPTSIIVSASIVSGLISLYLISKIFDALLLHQKINVVSMIVLAISPVFIYQSVSVGPHILGLPLLLGLILSILRKKKILSIFLAAALPWSGIVVAAIALAAVLSLKARKEKIAHIVGVLIVSSIAYIAVQKPTLVFTPQLPIAAEMGALIGFSFFGIIVAGVGFYKMWEHKRKLYPLFLLTFAIFAVSFYIEEARIYANILIAVFTAYGLLRMANRKWSSQTMKTACLGLIFIGLVAAYVGYSVDYSSQKPTKEDITAISHISSPASIVSYPSYGPWIAHYTNNKVVFTHPQAEDKENETRTVFNSRSLKETKSFFNAQNATYLYIDNEMRHGLVWNNDQEGILFLLRNNETFKSIYREGEFEVWRIQ